MNEPLIDPDLSIRLVLWMSWLLIAMGVLKLLVYVVGEWIPGAFSGLKSESARRFMTGKGNRLLFGLGGLLTALLGAVFLGLGHLLALLFSLSGN